MFLDLTQQTVPSCQLTTHHQGQSCHLDTCWTQGLQHLICFVIASSK